MHIGIILPHRVNAACTPFIAELFDILMYRGFLVEIFEDNVFEKRFRPHIVKAAESRDFLAQPRT